MLKVYTCILQRVFIHLGPLQISALVASFASRVPLFLLKAVLPVQWASFSVQKVSFAVQRASSARSVLVEIGLK